MEHPTVEAPERYDRAAASAILARLASPGLFSAGGHGISQEHLGRGRTIRYRMTPVDSGPDSPLSAMRTRYRERFMPPCPLEAITFATHRVVWEDGDAIPNVAHAGPSSLGPVVPIVAREATLALWRALAANRELALAIDGLSDDEDAVLAGTTTDREPMEIFRIGVEAGNRALVQHAYLADQTPYRTPDAFARAMRDSGIFGIVASTWYWELQAATLRRGMIPVSFCATTDGALRYTGESVALLRAMKDRTIATAREVMARATGEEGLTVAEALQKYHYEEDLIARQYALLAPAEQPRCLGQMTNVFDGRRYSVLPAVVDAFVEAFVRLLDLVVLEESGDGLDLPLSDSFVGSQTRVFRIPDMNCSHCRMSISGLLTSLDARVVEIDLTTKRVVVDFPSVDVRDQAFGAIRAAGYTVVGAGRG